MVRCVLDLNSARDGFLLEALIVDVLGVVFLLQFSPLTGLLFDQVADDALGSDLLLLAAYKV